ncbi:MAG: zinc-finger domain-containing protein [Mariprofundaceae bacterium]
MNQQATQTTDRIVSCSDHGQHPLVYINLDSGHGSCQYCGKLFARTGPVDIEGNEPASTS